MEVVIDDETWAQLKDYAEAIPMPELRLKGFATPVQAYKLGALHTRDEIEKKSLAI
jgi:hypothetical protein